MGVSFNERDRDKRDFVSSQLEGGFGTRKLHLAMHSGSHTPLHSSTASFSSSVVVVNGGGDRHHHHHLGLGLVRTKSTCEESIGECLGGNEFELDSEINRRILATSQYISYGALQRNTVPCSRRGASYYNCRPGAQANPYNRGCSAITRCRS